MKTKTVIFVIGVFMLFVSCTSEPMIFNQGDIPEEDLITVYIDSALEIKRIDDTVVDWSSARDYMVKIPSGEHTLHIRYNSMGMYTQGSMPITAQFERGNTYLVDYSRSLSLDRVSYHIFLYNEEKQGKEVTIGGLWGYPEPEFENPLAYVFDASAERGNFEDYVKLHNKSTDSNISFNIYVHQPLAREWVLYGTGSLKGSGDTHTIDSNMGDANQYRYFAIEPLNGKKYNYKFYTSRDDLNIDIMDK